MTPDADNDRYVNPKAVCRGQGRDALPPGALTDLLRALPDRAWRWLLAWAGVTEAALHDVLCECAE